MISRLRADSYARNTLAGLHKQGFASPWALWVKPVDGGRLKLFSGRGGRRVLYAARSHIGLVRQLNEDAYAVVPLPQTDESMLLVVADGMGGASAGEVASRIAVDTICASIQRASSEEWANVPEVLYGAVAEANRAICQSASQTPEYQGMGTTVVAVIADDQSMTVAHAGDSRVYAFIQDEFRRLTEDHSLVGELVRRGQLTEQEAMTHPQRNIVTRSLGTTEFGYPDVGTHSWYPSDAVLLCSDGLSNLVSEREIESTLRDATQCTTESALESLVDSLLNLALDRGGQDNITIILCARIQAGERA